MYHTNVHDVCSSTLAESPHQVEPQGLRTFKIVFLFYFNWDRPFEAQNEKKKR